MTQEERDSGTESWVIKNVQSDRIISTVYDSHSEASTDAREMNAALQSEAYQVVQFYPTAFGSDVGFIRGGNRG